MQPIEIVFFGLTALVLFGILTAILTRLMWMIITIPLRIVWAVVSFPFRLLK